MSAESSGRAANRWSHVVSRQSLVLCACLVAGAFLFGTFGWWIGTILETRQTGGGGGSSSRRQPAANVPRASNSAITPRAPPPPPAAAKPAESVASGESWYVLYHDYLASLPAYRKHTAPASKKDEQTAAAAADGEAVSRAARERERERAAELARSDYNWYPTYREYRGMSAFSRSRYHCAVLVARYGITVGADWGMLSPDARRRYWQDCDLRLIRETVHVHTYACKLIREQFGSNDGATPAFADTRWTIVWAQLQCSGWLHRLSPLHRSWSESDRHSIELDAIALVATLKDKLRTESSAERSKIEAEWDAQSREEPRHVSVPPANELSNERLLTEVGRGHAALPAAVLNEAEQQHNSHASAPLTPVERAARFKLLTAETASAPDTDPAIDWSSPVTVYNVLALASASAEMESDRGPIVGWVDLIAHSNSDQHSHLNSLTQLSPAARDAQQMELCRVWRQRYRLIPAYGVMSELPRSLTPAWRRYGCDTCHLLGEFMNPEIARDGSVKFQPRVRSQSEPQSLPPASSPSNGRRTLVVAICLSTTTKSEPHIVSLSQLSLFNILLPSIRRTVEPGFEYRIYVGFDAGDPFLDRPSIYTEVHNWFSSGTADSTVRLSIHLVRVHNPTHKPGPAFNQILSTAYADGADYFYRINDDTELCSPNWTSAFVTALQSFGVPYGVVGPDCAQGNQGILTHDFTHRTHLELFARDSYYPKALTDWWMDDWISRVYGPSRTRKLPHVMVQHHMFHHGTRYKASEQIRTGLDFLVVGGNVAVLKAALATFPTTKPPAAPVSTFRAAALQHVPVLPPGSVSAETLFSQIRDALVGLDDRRSHELRRALIDRALREQFGIGCVAIVEAEWRGDKPRPSDGSDLVCELPPELRTAITSTAS